MVVVQAEDFQGLAEEGGKLQHTGCKEMAKQTVHLRCISITTAWGPRGLGEGEEGAPPQSEMRTSWL